MDSDRTKNCERVGNTHITTHADNPKQINMTRRSIDGSRIVAAEEKLKEKLEVAMSIKHQKRRGCYQTKCPACETTMTLIVHMDGRCETTCEDRECGGLKF